MQDKTIICSCGNEFILTVGEQKFYKKNLLHEPKRCPDCREKRRRENEQREGRSDKQRHHQEDEIGRYA